MPTLERKYIAEIREWDWKRIKADAIENLKDNLRDHGRRCAGEDTVGLDWLGTIFGITPSGKFYTPFAYSNVTEQEARRDEAWHSALESVAEKHGMYVHHEDDSIFVAVGMDVLPFGQDTCLVCFERNASIGSGEDSYDVCSECAEDAAHEENEAHETRVCSWCRVLPAEKGDSMCQGCREGHDRRTD